MKPRGPRIPFDHVKEIYGDKLDKYSYQEMKRDPKLHKKIYKENSKNGDKYESVRGKVLDFVILIFIFFMLGIGVYFLLNSIAEA